MENHLIVNGRRLETPAWVVTWEDDRTIVPFSGDKRSPATVNEIIIHESVTSSVKNTERVLKNRGLGVHLMVNPEGRVTQHADLVTTRLRHAGGHNGPSIAVEVINLYYGAKGANLPWSRVIDAGWADKGKYIVPTIEQCEAVTTLIQTITLAGLVPRKWIGAEGGFLAMSKIALHRRVRTPGIWAHTYFAHADGSFLVLYAILRLEFEFTKEGAYNQAITMASTSEKRIRPESRCQWGLLC